MKASTIAAYNFDCVNESQTSAANHRPETVHSGHGGGGSVGMRNDWGELKTIFWIWGVHVAKQWEPNFISFDPPMWATFSLMFNEILRGVSPNTINSINFNHCWILPLEFSCYKSKFTRNLFLEMMSSHYIINNSSENVWCDLGGLPKLEFVIYINFIGVRAIGVRALILSCCTWVGGKHATHQGARWCNITKRRPADYWIKFPPNVFRCRKRHIKIWHINNFSVTPVTDPPGREPDSSRPVTRTKTFMFLGFRTQHINFWPLATGRETPPPPSREGPPPPGQSPKNLFMFMCLFLSWVLM